MLYKAVIWTSRRLQPDEGWLPLFLLLATVSMLVSAVITVGWVPEESVVIWTALISLLLSSLLAKRPIGWVPAWAFILSYGLVVTVIQLAQLWPPLAVLVRGWGPISAHSRQNLGLFVDRIGGWLEAVIGGERSEETIVFALGLGLLAWLLAAYAGWSTFRQHRPLAGLTLMGFALAVNSYYGDAPLWPAAMFVALTTLLAAIVHYVDLEQMWDSKGVDYSSEIRLDLLIISGGVAWVLLAIALVLPTVNFRALSRAVLDRPAVHQAEDTLERAFAGVRQPRRDLPGEGLGDESGGSRGTLPRSFLLGNPPELYDILVMTATVIDDAVSAHHWRGLSYDIYTGRGWALSEERQESIAANQTIPLPSAQQQTTIEQSVQWVLGNAATRYTLGLPLRFDQGVVAIWRGLEDLSRVTGEGNAYTAVSRLSVATPSELRQASLADVPPAIMARYTELPDSVPDRVHNLAQEVGEGPGVSKSPFDQARALERFLRQYPYSLEVDLPPLGTDPVDFFLFDLQAGYCDYYASTMVVLARSLGLPARLATGFLAQPADSNGVQTIYQINAHSWAEVYFAGFGWVEFEPTAAFPTRAEASPGLFPADEEFEEPFPDPEPPPIPDREPRHLSSLWALGLIALILAGWWLWHRRQGQAVEKDGIHWAYGRLIRSAQKLGQPTLASQTPAEFEAALVGRLRQLERQQLTGQVRLTHVYPEIERLTDSFVARQYSRKEPSAGAAVESWRRIRGRLWLLGVLDKMRTLAVRPSSGQ